MLKIKTILVCSLFFLTNDVLAESIPHTFKETSKSTMHFETPFLSSSVELIEDSSALHLEYSLQIGTYSILLNGMNQNEFKDEFSVLSANAILPINIMNSLLKSGIPTPFRAIARDTYYSSFMKTGKQSKRTQ